MHRILIFFVGDTAKIQRMPQQMDVELVRGERSAREHSNQTVWFADWYVEVASGEDLRIQNKTCSILAFDGNGHIDWPGCRHGSAQTRPSLTRQRRRRQMTSMKNRTARRYVRLWKNSLGF